MGDDVDPSKTVPTTDKMKECTPTACTEDLNQRNLQCDKCKRKVHYKCTRLPLYQLQQYVTFGNNYRKYNCENCVEIQNDLLEVIPKTLSNERLNIELETERKRVKTFEHEVSELRKEIKR